MQSIESQREISKRFQYEEILKIHRMLDWK